MSKKSKSGKWRIDNDSGSHDVSATGRVVLYSGTEAYVIKDGVEVLPVTHFRRELVARR